MRIEQVSNEIRGIIPVISQLCFQDDNLSRAYMCHPDVTHVVKSAYYFAATFSFLGLEYCFGWYYSVHLRFKRILKKKKLTEEHTVSREGGFCGYRNIQMMISHIIDAKLNGSSFFEGRIPTILQLQDMVSCIQRINGLLGIFVPRQLSGIASLTWTMTVDRVCVGHRIQRPRTSRNWWYSRH